MAKVFQEWIGRKRDVWDRITSVPMRGFAATLEHPPREWIPGDSVPLLAHWLYFLDFARQSELGDDGHPARGGFLPPVMLPRRMWAGSRVRFLEPMHIGDKVCRTSTIVDIESKSGSTGDLIFVTVEHTIARDDGTALIQEQQDIVYRDAPASSAPHTAAARPATAAPAGSAVGTEPPATWQREVTPASTLLFRYSALTFNSHRIHYDRDYATQVEGYPGLVVHGPLQATLMLDLVGRMAPHNRVTSFRFRGRAPLFDGGSMLVCGEPDNEGCSVALTTRGLGGAVGMDGVAELEVPLTVPAQS